MRGLIRLLVARRRSAQVDLSAFPGASGIDPFDLVHDDLRKLAGNVKDLLGVQHPVLATVAKYAPVAQLRPRAV